MEEAVKSLLDLLYPSTNSPSRFAIILKKDAGVSKDYEVFG